MTHDGIMGNVPEQRAGSLPEQARARHASVPRGRLGNGEEGRKKRARHVSLASPLRIETPEVGAKLSEGEALIGSGKCEHEKKAIGRESLAKWKRQIESESEEVSVIRREILTPLSRLPEPDFEEEVCHLLEVDPGLAETHTLVVSFQEQERRLASCEILESVEECYPLDVRNMGSLIRQQQVQMRPLMEEPEAFLATEYVPLKLIGLDFCRNFLPTLEEKFSVTVKSETEYCVAENAEVKFHTVNVMEGNPREVSEVTKNIEVGKVEVWGGEREVARVKSSKARGRKRRSDEVESKQMVGSEEGLCLGLVGEEITIARLAATIRQMPGDF